MTIDLKRTPPVRALLLAADATVVAHSLLVPVHVAAQAWVAWALIALFLLGRGLLERLPRGWRPLLTTLLIGPTGVGKTFVIKLIAQKIGVPFVKGDATKFSETGYVGGDVEDLVRDLVREANGDIERAQYGIIYIDEIDKIAGSNNLYGPDVSRTGVQRALLKPMEETEVDLKVPHDIVSQMEVVEQYRKTGKREKKLVNTKNILFVVSGAFNGLEKIIGERLDSKGLGFGAELKSPGREEALFAQVKSEDLMNYGFESEFIGRLPVIALFESLTVEDLYSPAPRSRRTRCCAGSTPAKR